MVRLITIKKKDKADILNESQGERGMEGLLEYNTRIKALFI